MVAAVLLLLAGCARAPFEPSKKYPRNLLTNTSAATVASIDIPPSTMLRSVVAHQAPPVPVTLDECLVGALERVRYPDDAYWAPLKGAAGAADIDGLGRVGHPVILFIRPRKSKIEIDTQLRVYAGLHDLAARVETAYWELYRSQAVLAAREEALKYAQELLDALRAAESAKAVTLPTLHQAEAQVLALAEQRLQAIDNRTARPGVLEAELTLRQLCGLSPDDGFALAPATAPRSELLPTDWQSEVDLALSQNPEILVARQQVAEAHAKPQRPQLCVSKKKMAELREQARLLCEQKTDELERIEEQTVFDLVRAYRGQEAARAAIDLQRARREQAAALFAAQQQAYAFEQITLDVLLEARRDLLEAEAAEISGLVDLNLAILQYQRVQGTLLGWHGIVFCFQGLTVLGGYIHPSPSADAPAIIEAEMVETEVVEPVEPRGDLPDVPSATIPRLQLPGDAELLPEATTPQALPPILPPP